MRRTAPVIHIFVALLALAVLAGSGVALEPLEPGIQVPMLPIPASGDVSSAAAMSLPAICLTGYEAVPFADNRSVKLSVMDPGTL